MSAEATVHACHLGELVKEAGEPDFKNSNGFKGSTSTLIWVKYLRLSDQDLSAKIELARRNCKLGHSRGGGGFVRQYV